ncbi:hypothetical protein BHM03_00016209 [Ensete ventricosum]|nr:hypothetical protein BHM03_00016209 [Ensete ventricosum]
MNLVVPRDGRGRNGDSPGAKSRVVISPRPLPGIEATAKPRAASALCNPSIRAISNRRSSSSSSAVWCHSAVLQPPPQSLSVRLLAAEFARNLSGGLFSPYTILAWAEPSEAGPDRYNKAQLVRFLFLIG